MTEHDGPFDAEELVRWAETYGHPEEWVKRAQAAHARAEELFTELERLTESKHELENGEDDSLADTEADLA